MSLLSRTSCRPFTASPVQLLPHRAVKDIFENGAFAMLSPWVRVPTARPPAVQMDSTEGQRTTAQKASAGESEMIYFEVRH
jgi:hypothetical protein